MITVGNLQRGLVQVSKKQRDTFEGSAENRLLRMPLISKVKALPVQLRRDGELNPVKLARLNYLCNLRISAAVDKVCNKC